jgi:hypothetical protein
MKDLLTTYLLASFPNKVWCRIFTNYHNLVKTRKPIVQALAKDTNEIKISPATVHQEFATFYCINVNDCPV